MYIPSQAFDNSMLDALAVVEPDGGTDDICRESVTQLDIHGMSLSILASLLGGALLDIWAPDE